jgi:hypothetical protein
LEVFVLTLIRRLVSEGKRTTDRRDQRVVSLGGVAAVGVLLMVSGCGVSYNSPSVQKQNDELPVSIVAMTPKSISYANSQAYTPQALPDAFYYVAGGTANVRGAGAVPAAPYLPEERRTRLEYRPMPDIEPIPYRIGVGDVLLLATRGNATTVEQCPACLRHSRSAKATPSETMVRSQSRKSVWFSWAA